MTAPRNAPVAQEAVPDDPGGSATLSMETPQQPPYVPPIGTILGGRYEIRHSLGSGGMAAVMLAYDRTSKRDVALKFVNSDTSHNSSTHEQLRQELKLAQRIMHLNVCRINDIYEIDGYFFISMEYIIGETLAARCRRSGPMDIGEALEIARAIIAGLEAAHQEQVVHCDLKPENVLIRHEDHRVLLTDFGQALTAMTNSDGGPGGLAGTPAYMAKEQLERLPIDPRTDLYAFGCVLYEMLCGNVPYPQITSFSTAIACLQLPIPDPRDIRPDLPSWLAELIIRMLQRSPTARYPSATVVRRELEGPSTKPKKRLSIRWTVAISIVGAAIVALPLVPRKWMPESQPLLPIVSETLADLVISPNGKWLAYVSKREGVWRIYVDSLVAGGDSGRIIYENVFFKTIRWTADSHALLAVTTDERVFDIPLEGPIKHLQNDCVEIEDCAGNWVLAEHDKDGSGRTTVHMYQGSNLHGPKKELLKIPSHQSLLGMRCDRAGRHLTYSLQVDPARKLRAQDIFVLSLEGKSTPKQLTFDRQANSYPTFSADGRSILFTTRRKDSTELWEISIDGGAAVPIKTGVGKIGSSDVSPDGRWLAYGTDIDQVVTFSYKEDTHELKPVGNGINYIFSPWPASDGHTLLVGVLRDGQRYAAVVNIQDGNTRLLRPVEEFVPTHAANELVYTIQARDSGFEMWAMAIDSGHQREILKTKEPIFSLNIDERNFIHYTMGNPKGPFSVWKVPLSGGLPVLVDSQARHVIPAPSGGWRLAGYKAENKIIWHLVAPEAQLDAPPSQKFDALRQVSWAADGKSFIAWDGAVIWQYFVDGAPRKELLRRTLLEGRIALSPDGNTLYFAESTGQTLRQVITNFSERPRPFLSWWSRLFHSR